MSFRLFYSLIFLKLYRFTSKTRSKEGAIIASSLIIGFLIVLWILDILAALKIYNIIPKEFIMPLFGTSVGINIYYVMRKKKYESMIAEIESKKIPIVFHVLAYLLFLWTFVGILFL